MKGFLLTLFLPILAILPQNGQIEIEKKEVVVGEEFVIILTLHPPQDSQIRIGELKHNLLQYGGLGEPPFTFVKHEIQMVEEGLYAAFTLLPQVPGNYSLTFQDIHFYKEQKELPVDTAISEIVPVQVILPQAPPFKPIAPTLLPLEPEYPIELSLENRAILLENPPLIILREFPWGYLVVGCLLILFFVLSVRSRP